MFSIGGKCKAGVTPLAYELQFEPVLAYGPQLVRGTLLTIGLSFQAIALGTMTGIAGALARTQGPRWLRMLVRGYVELIRNTPLLVQLFVIYFALPLLGLRVSAYGAALFGMTVNLGAYVTGIVYAGIAAIPITQIEAGQAMSLSRWQIFRHIILLPALKVIYPTLTSQYTLTLLSSSIVSAISANELSSTAALIESNTFRSFETYIIVAIIYVVTALLFRLLYWVVGQFLFGPWRSRGRRPVAVPEMLGETT